MLVRTMQFNVAGVSMQNRDGTERQRLIEANVAAGMSIELRPEPSNLYDSDAVAVLCRGYQIGYIPATFSPRVSEYLTRGYEYEARVLDVLGGTDEKPTLGVIFEAAFWRGGKRPADPYAEGTANNNASRLARGLAPFQPYRSKASSAKKPGCLSVALFVILTTAAVLLFLFARAWLRAPFH